MSETDTVDIEGRCIYHGVRDCDQLVTGCHGLNAAKMREALVHIREYATVALSHTTDGHVIDAVHNMDAWAKAALSAPPRNCDLYSDRYSAETEWAFQRFKHRTTNLEFEHWLFAEAKGEAK